MVRVRDGVRVVRDLGGAWRPRPTLRSLLGARVRGPLDGCVGGREGEPLDRT